ncbi:helix-turn-helix domain-containing protein [Amycolatopsis sp. NPDC059020]
MFAATEGYVREVIHAFNTSGFAALSPKWSGGRPHKVGPAARDQICRIAACKPTELGCRSPPGACQAGQLPRRPRLDRGEHRDRPGRSCARRACPGRRGRPGKPAKIRTSWPRRPASSTSTTTRPPTDE